MLLVNRERKFSSMKIEVHITIIRNAYISLKKQKKLPTMNIRTCRDNNTNLTINPIL